MIPRETRLAEEKALHPSRSATKASQWKERCSVASKGTKVPLQCAAERQRQKEELHRSRSGKRYRNRSARKASQSKERSFARKGTKVPFQLQKDSGRRKNCIVVVVKRRHRSRRGRKASGRRKHCIVVVVQEASQSEGITVRRLWDQGSQASDQREVEFW